MYKEQEINIKRQLLSYLEKLDKKEFKTIDTLSVKDLKEQLEGFVKKHDDKILENENAIINDFKDVYLKVFTNDGGLFGDELEVYHILMIDTECYTTEYNRMYKCVGSRISFNNLNVHKRDLTSNAHDLFSEEELRKMTVITKEEHNEYELKYKAFQTLLKGIIKDK